MKILLFKELDPRAKLFIVLCITTLSVLYKDIYKLLIILIVVILICLIMGVKIKGVLKKTAWMFISIAVIQSLFSKGGPAIVEVFGICILSTTGLLMGLETLLRMVIVILSAGIMTTSKPEDMVLGLISMKLPYEIPFMISISIRFLPILTEEFKDAVTAIQLRGVDIKKIPFKKKIAVYTYLITPVTLNSIIKARNLATAMEMRGFRAYPNRTYYRKLKMKKKDYQAIVVSFLVTLIFIIYFK